MNVRTLALTAVIILAAMFRFIPGLPPNFKPISAMLIFGVIRYSNRSVSLTLPVLLVLATDVVQQILYHFGHTVKPGFYPGMEWVYGAYVVMALLASFFRGTKSPGSIAGVTLVGAFIFFVLSNFGYWLVGDLDNLYPKTPAGLLECYVAAIPFFWKSFIGDAVFALVLFGGWQLAEMYVPALRPASAST
jgi:hypothetical protein